MRIYHYDNLEGDQRLPQTTVPNLPVSTLTTLNIIHQHHPGPSSIEPIARQRGYKNRDEITVSPTALGSSYDSKVKDFFTEHLHEDEEIRYILDGTGFFDVRDREDKWIRIAAGKGDLLILPAGVFHRFTTDSADYINAMRLFKDNPGWEAVYRGKDSDASPARKAYLQSIGLMK